MQDPSWRLRSLCRRGLDQPQLAHLEGFLARCQPGFECLRFQLVLDGLEVRRGVRGFVALLRELQRDALDLGVQL